MTRTRWIRVGEQVRVTLHWSAPGRYAVCVKADALTFWPVTAGYSGFLPVVDLAAPGDVGIEIVDNGKPPAYFERAA